MYRYNKNNQEHGLKPEKKDPWDVNPFDTCKAFSGCKIIEYRVEGTTREEAYKNLLKEFYEIEEKHFKLTHKKGIITNEPIEYGPIHDTDGKITGWFRKGKFHCYIPERIEEKEEEEIR